MAHPFHQGGSFSSSTHRWDHDVFLSFRGEDTRNGFTGYLYSALCDNGFKTFIDDGLQRGEQISEELLKAIKLSRISIIIFSQNFAFSPWCLDEVVEILNCKPYGQLVVPVFYKVDPSDIRKFSGKFSAALAQHEERFQNNMMKVHRWRVALYDAASLSGWHYEDGSEYKFIENIIRNIVYTKSSVGRLFVAKYPIGLDYRAKDIELLLDIGVHDVRTVGILGLGGIGKTTIAKAVYNRIAVHFEGSCFLESVREKSGTNDGTIKLQEKLLSSISRGKHLEVESVAHGINMIRERLQSKRVLLILDDVDKSKQIENLFGNFDWFVSGSRVLITTRDAHLLATLKVYATYKVKELVKDEALELFNQHAFQGNKHEEEDYFELANQVIQYAKGLPLALTIIGSDLCGRPKSEWESAIHQYREILEGDIHEILKESYDGLRPTERDAGKERALPGTDLSLDVSLRLDRGAGGRWEVKWSKVQEVGQNIKPTEGYFKPTAPFNQGNPVKAKPVHTFKPKHISVWRPKTKQLTSSSSFPARETQIPGISLASSVGGNKSSDVVIGEPMLPQAVLKDGDMPSSSDSSKSIIPSSDDLEITWLGVHVDSICCGRGSSSVSDDIVSVSDDIDHHSFPSDVGLQMDANLPKFHPGVGFSDALDDLGSSSRAWSCDNTELQTLPAVSSTFYGSDLDHGVLNSGGVSGPLIGPNSGLAGSYLGFESTFHSDVHDLDSSSIVYPFARIGYLDSNASIDGCSPLVLDDIEHHSLPSDVLPVDTTNGSGLGLGRQDLDSFASIGYNDSDVGEHWLLRFLKAPPFSILCQCFQWVRIRLGSARFGI